MGLQVARSITVCIGSLYERVKRWPGWQGVLPNMCQLCDARSPALVCGVCCATWLGVASRRCACCAHHLDASAEGALGLLCGACLYKPPAFISTTVLGDYAAPQERLIWALKFGGKLPLAHFFATALAQACQQNCLTIPLPQLLLPIPLGAKRLSARGYNQAWEITRRFARQSHIPACAKSLIRIRDTSMQAGLSSLARRKNLRGAFIAQERVRGQHIGVVDDVMTSGETLEAAARALLRAGALSVRNYVVLRTPKEKTRSQVTSPVLGP
ncbi:MAG: ComF family protein [Ottowia sp.]|nr:ComF family protein [Ottowia sp.]